jgi:hypothetical protein
VISQNHKFKNSNHAITLSIVSQDILKDTEMISNKTKSTDSSLNKKETMKGNELDIYVRN